MAITKRTGSTRDEFEIAAIGDRDGRYADAHVLVGGDQQKFHPIMRSRKWQGEAWFTIDPRKVIGTERPRWVDNENRVEIDLGDEQHRWYERPDGKVEYDIILGVQPPSNVFTFDVDFPAGMEFVYQPSLTPFELARGNVRPPLVVGSYAVYWPKNHQKYKTGKLCHISRPVFIDRLGDRRRGDLLIDPVAKTMTVTCHPAWLANATYPVTLDPTIGYTSAGASQDQTNQFYLMNAYTVGSAIDSGTHTMYVSCESLSGSTQAGGGVYDDADGGSPDGDDALHTSQATFTTTSASQEWQSASLTLPEISSSANVWLALLGTTNWATYYDSGLTCYYLNYAGGPTLEDPWGTAGGNVNFKISMYIDYTSTGGGLSIPVARHHYSKNLRGG